MWYSLTTTAAVVLILSQTVCGNNWMDYGEPSIDVDATYDDQLMTALARDQEHEMHSPFITGYKYVSGGAGEGKQHLSPNGEIPNHPEVKTDEELPSYCNPPNPCPLGFEANDCDASPMLKFTAEYSRLYQTEQDCQCDNDHDQCFLNNIVYPLSSSSPTRDMLKRSRRVRRDTKTENKTQRHPSHRGQTLKFHVAKKSPMSAKF